MNKDLHNIDDLFRNSIDDHIEEVPGDVWKNIDHSLDKKQAAFYKRKYFAVRAAAIFLVLIGGLAIAALLHYRESAKPSETDSANRRSISTPNSNNNVAVNHSQSKTSQEVATEINRKAEQNTTSDKENTNATNTQTDNKNTTVEQSRSKENKQANTDNYSTQKTEQLSVSVSENRLKNQKKAEKHVATNNNFVGIIHEDQNKTTEGSIEEQINLRTDKAGNSLNFQRATIINGTLLSTNKPDLAAIPSSNINNSPFSISGAGTIKDPRSKIYSGSWSIAPMYAQNINLNTLKDDDHYRDPRNNSHEARRTEQESSSFTAGIGIQKEFSNSIALQTGVQYFSSQKSIQPKTIFAREDGRGFIRYQFQCSSGNSYITSKTGTAPAVGDSIKTNFSESKLSYLQVPLLVSYKISFGKFSLLPSIGLQTNFLLSGKLSSSLAQTAGEEKVSSSIDGLRFMYFSGVIQPQFNYSLNDKISLDLNPNINFSLSPINKETAVRTYQNMISLGAGIRVKL